MKIGNFSFIVIFKEDILTDTKVLDVSKAFQASDITVIIIIEGLLSRQLLEFFDNILYGFQCAFRKGYGTQQCLSLMLEIWKGATDNNKVFGAFLIELSKASDCLSHDLLIAKLHTYGLDIDSLNILQDYLSNPKQKWALFIALGKKYSPWYLKGLYWDHFWSIYLCVTCS